MRLYLMLAGALALAALVGWAFVERSRAESWRADATAAIAEQARIKKDLDIAVAVNVGNRLTIDKLTAQRLANEAIMLKFTENVEAVSKAAADLNNEVDELGRANETVNGYLNSLVPADLRQLYENRR